MCKLYREWGIFAATEPVLRVVDRIEKLDARWIHPMHGGSLPKEAVPGYTDALRSEEFAFEGKLFGRVILD
jgi:hypothetical protein